MTGMDDLVTFLRAQLDEDERKVAAMEREEGRVRTAPIFQGHPPDWLAGVDIFVSSKRWRAEVDAKRRILDEIMEEANGLDMSVDLDRRVGTRDMVTEPYLGDQLARLLALPYADRPGYREEWRL